MNVTINIRRQRLQPSSGQYILFYKASAPEYESVAPWAVYYTLGSLDIVNNVFPDHDSVITQYESIGVAAVMSSADSLYPLQTNVLGWVRDDSASVVVTEAIALSNTVGQQGVAIAAAQTAIGNLNASVSTLSTNSGNQSTAINTLNTNLSGKLDATAINSNQYVANAPADATTNYNVVTTTLGALVGAVNETNTKQNDIANKLNAVISALKTVGILKTNP